MTQHITPALTVLVFLAGCGDEPTGDEFSVDGVVRGTVVAATGPVADSWVAIEGGYPLGNGNLIPLYDSVRTNAQGGYVGRVAVGNLPDAIARVTIRVWPPPGGGLAPASRADLEVRMTASLPPPDTLVADFVLTLASP